MEGCDCHFILTSFPTQPALLLLGNSLVLLWVKCPSIATGVCDKGWSPYLGGSSMKLWIVTIKDKIYLDLWLFGFFNKNFVLLPVNYSNDGRNCLTTQEHYTSSELQLTQLSTHWNVLRIQSPPGDLSCRYHNGTWPHQVLRGDRNSNEKDTSTLGSKSNLKGVKKYFWCR